MTPQVNALLNCQMDHQTDDKRRDSQRCRHLPHLRHPLTLERLTHNYPMEQVRRATDCTHQAQQGKIKNASKPRLRLSYRRPDQNRIGRTSPCCPHGMRGTYQHCSEKHLHRYLAEFDFRYKNRIGLGVDDNQRAARALEGVRGKRLTYRASGSSRSAT